VHSPLLCGSPGGSRQIIEGFWVAPKVGISLVDQVMELATDRSKRAGTPSRWNIGTEIAIAIGVEKMVEPAIGAWLATSPSVCLCF
jgi:hypothetical protein